MIPYFTLSKLDVWGPFAIQPFGSLVVIGVIVGAIFARSLFLGAGISKDEFAGFIRWAVASSFIGAHLFAVVWFNPERLTSEGWWVIFKFWDGLSSFGGFIGGTIGTLCYIRKIKNKSYLLYADASMQGLVVGWIFGRLACTITHDHLGILSDSFIAFRYQAGARLNMGFMELLAIVFIIFPLMQYTRHKKPVGTGFSTVVVLISYNFIRFILDFFRAWDLPRTDLRYMGLTVAQLGCLIGFGFGLYLWWHVSKKNKGLKIPTQDA